MIAMRFLILDVVLPHTSPEISALRIRETIYLIHTYSSGLGVVDHIVQQRMHPDSTTYIGSGKVQEVFDLIKKDGIRYVVLNDIVQPGQIFELKKVLQKAYFEIEVWDRVDLILKIFEKHARTSEARMQIELAAMRHMGPRIFGMGLVLSRQGGGIGAKGLGETNTERMKRHWREEIQATQDKLKKLNTDRLQRMQRRRELGMKTVAIVGYTNAGKSSLFNALTGKKNLSKDALFATLDSTLGKLKRSTAYDPVNPAPDVLVSDTIGFISNLPPRLIEAFKSTLLETIHADLLIHVIDASDPEIDRKISVVQETLKDLDADQIPQITVLNKIDLPAARTLEEIKSLTAHLDPLYLSAADGGGVKELRDRVLNVLSGITP
jgi:GTP-binding protein HflX